MLKDRPIVREIIIMAVGEVLLCALMVGVFAIIGLYSAKVLYGALLGFGLAMANFLIMTLGVAIASQKAAEQNVNGGKATMYISMFARYALMIVVLFFAGRSGNFSLISMLLPLVFVRFIISLGEFIRKSGEKKE